MQLVLSSQAGEATIRAWDRDAVRVQASHGTRERVEVQTADNTVRVRARTASGSRGPAGLVDYTVTVPRWMPVSLSGTYLAANIEGAGAEVNVETVGGDITVKGGSGAVTLRSIEGEIIVENASGQGAGNDGQRLDPGARRIRRRHRRNHQRRRGGVELEGVEPRGVDRERRRALRRADRRQGALPGDDAQRRHPGEPWRQRQCHGVRADVRRRLLQRLPGHAARGHEQPRGQQAVQLHARRRQRPRRAAVVPGRHPRQPRAAAAGKTATARRADHGRHDGIEVAAAEVEAAERRGPEVEVVPRSTPRGRASTPTSRSTSRPGSRSTPTSPPRWHRRRPSRWTLPPSVPKPPRSPRPSPARSSGAATDRLVEPQLGTQHPRVAGRAVHGEASAPHDGTHRVVVGEHVAVQVPHAEPARQLDQGSGDRGAQSLPLHAVGDQDGESRRCPPVRCAGCGRAATNCGQAIAVRLLGDEGGADCSASTRQVSASRCWVVRCSSDVTWK